MTGDSGNGQVRRPVRRAIAVGVEEEFHLVETVGRSVVSAAPALLASLPKGRFTAELQQTVLETNSDPQTSLAALRDDLVDARATLADVAARHGLAAVAAGSPPLASLDDVEPTGYPRYLEIADTYSTLVREQLICGAHVHVDVPDRETAVAALPFIAPWVPVFLALTASSPYWLGVDTGYASWRSVVWRRWPTTGPAGVFRDAAAYDEMVAGLVATGVICDPGMVYYDVRPSDHLPTLELRVCDACPRVDDVVLVAGLFRALVMVTCDAIAAGEQPPAVRDEWLRAATWRAARSGLEGDLVDPLAPGTASARDVVRSLLTHVRPALEELGDWVAVEAAAHAALARGGAAAAQRQAVGKGGSVADAVDLLVAQTVARPPWPPRLLPTVPEQPGHPEQTAPAPASS